MADTKTEDQPKTETVEAPKVDLVEDGEGDITNLPATSEDQSGTGSQMKLLTDFQKALEVRASEIGSQLPSTMPRATFIDASLAAVRSNPAILAATPRSLMSAVIKAAQDGLRPDGREGVITVYRTKVNNVYQNVAQWNPMLFGIRKRAKETDGLILSAKIIYAGDEFDYEEGDTPRIYHKPARRGRDFVTDAQGDGAYTIFRDADLRIIYRDVMWAGEILATRSQSKVQNSLMWTKFWTEGWCKAVVRRASKSVPSTPEFTRMVQRDDENFDFRDATGAAPTGAPIQERLAGGTPVQISYASQRPATVVTVDPPKNDPPAADHVEAGKDTAEPSKPARAKAAAPERTPEGAKLAEQLQGSLLTEDRAEEDAMLTELREAIAATEPMTVERLQLLREEYAPALELAGEATQLAAKGLFLWAEKAIGK